MAIIYGSNGGFDVSKSSSVTGVITYEPVSSNALDLDFIYKNLPSFYRELMANRKMFSDLWSASAQILSSDLLSLWHADLGMSQEEITTYTQRKWYEFDFIETLDLSRENFDEVGSLSYSYNTKQLNTVSRSSGGINLVGDFLTGEITDKMSFSVDYEFTLTSSQEHSGFLVGFINKDSKRLRDSLSFGVTHLKSSSLPNAAFRLTLCHATPTADAAGVSVVTGASTVQTGVKYSVSATYDYQSTVAKASLKIIDAEVFSFTSIEQGSESFQNFFDNSSGNSIKDTDKISIVIDGTTVVANVSEVDGTTIRLDRACIPVNALFTLKVLRDQTIDTVSLNLKRDTTDSSFTSNTFGVFNLDTNSSYKEGSITYDRLVTNAEASFAIHKWSYFDPSNVSDVKYLPSLQTDSTGKTKYEIGNDYEILDKGIAFKNLPSKTLVAEHVAFDDKSLYKNFGYFVGLKESASTDEYKRKIQGLLYANFKGPTVKSLRIGINLLLGLPVVEVAGTVTSHNKSYSGTLGQIVIAGITYLYPLSAGSSLVVGDVVKRFDSICDAVEIRDYISDPNWYENFNDVHELQKYHLFNPKINLEALTNVSIEDVDKFISDIKPTFKGYRTSMYRTEEDETDVSDSISLDLNASLLDTILDRYDPRFDHTLNGLYSYATDFGLIPGTYLSELMEDFSRLDTANEFWSEPENPDLDIVPHILEVDQSNDKYDGYSKLTVSTDLAEASSNAELPHYFGSLDSEGTGVSVSSGVLTDLGANFTFSGTAYIILVSGSDVYYSECTVDSTTTLDLVASIPDGTYDYQVKLEYDLTDIQISSGTGTLGSRGSGDFTVQFVDSSGTFVADIDTDQIGTPLKTTYLVLENSSYNTAIIQVVRVDSSTEIQCLLSHHTPLSGDDALEDYIGSAESYKIVEPLGLLTVRKSAAISGTCTLGQSTIVYRRELTFGLDGVKVGDDVIIRSPAIDAGKYRVTAASYVGLDVTLTINKNFSSSGTCDFEVYSNNRGNAYDVSVSYAGGSSLATLPYEQSVTFTPIFEVDASYIRVGQMATALREMVARLWNTQTSFLNFDDYEISSPNDEVLITFSDGRADITA